MRLSITNLFTRIASTVNQSATAPTAGGDEWDLWIEYTNAAIQEWANAHNWEELKKTFYPVVTGTSQASLNLPDDFKELAQPPVHWGTGVSGGEEWPIIIPEEKYLYDTVTDKFAYKIGAFGDYNLLWNPPTLASGASIQITYYSAPTSLASPADIPIVPDSQFLVDRITAYVLESRSDGRFQEIETKAREKLLLMIENANASKFASYGSRIPVRSALRNQGWRVGRD